MAKDRVLFSDLPYICPMQQPALSIESILAALSQNETALPTIRNSTKYPLIHQSLSPQGLYTAILTIGKLLGVEGQAESLIEPLEERTNIIKHKLKFIAEDQKPTVLCLDSVSPASILQNGYLDALIELAGGIPYGNINNNSFSPDIIIVITDTPVPTLFSELPALLGSTSWASTPAVANDNIFVVQDPNALRQPGLNVADDAEILAEIISSKYFVFGKEGTSWIRFGLV